MMTISENAGARQARLGCLVWRVAAAGRPTAVDQTTMTSRNPTFVLRLQQWAKILELDLEEHDVRYSLFVRSRSD